MQVPIRKPGKYTHQKRDINLTEAKFQELQAELEKLIKTSRPKAIEEMQRLAAMGDFSENAGYQIAKGRVRGINDRISELEALLPRAAIIKTDKNGDKVKLGSTVTIEVANQQHTYLILGSAEADPSRGVISQNSPIGSVLMGHRVGDVVNYRVKDKSTECKIISIK